MDKKKIVVKILRGCSGSGKSTLREQWLSKQHYGIISRDELRSALFAHYGNKHDNKQENIITNISLDLLQQYIKAGFDIIIDNTNLKAKDVRPYLEIIEYYNKLNSNIVIKYVDLTDIPLKRLKEQNGNKENPIPDEVIERHFEIAKTSNSFYEDINKRGTKLNNDVSKDKAVIFDLDGTLAFKSKNRGWYDTEGYIQDALNDYVYENYKIHKAAKHKIIICTAREEYAKLETLDWLKTHNIEYDKIFFRKNDDRRKDHIVKQEMWEDILKNYYIVCMYDDRLTVVKHARQLGLNVFAVNHMFY